jgi:protein-tyrosine phosphatase
VPGITVASAGTGNHPGPATADTRAAASKVGLDLDAHRSRQLDDELVGRARLIVGLERAHVRDVVVREPGALARAFTLRELVRRARVVGPRPADTELGVWLTRVGAGRTPRDLLGAAAADDVADPAGRSRKLHESTVTELAALVDELAALAFP